MTEEKINLFQNDGMAKIWRTKGSDHAVPIHLEGAVLLVPTQFLSCLVEYCALLGPNLIEIVGNKEDIFDDVCRESLLLGGDQHFQGVDDVPQSRAGSLWLGNPQSGLRVGPWQLTRLTVKHLRGDLSCVCVLLCVSL